MSLGAEFSPASSSVSEHVTVHAQRTALFSASAAMHHAGCSACLFSIYMENREIASAFSGKEGPGESDVRTFCRTVEQSSADEWKNNGMLIRRIFSRVSERISYVLLLCYEDGKTGDSVNLAELGEMLDSAVRLIDEVDFQSATVDMIARSAKLAPVGSSTSMTSMLVAAGNEISGIFGCRGFAVLLITQAEISVSGGSGNALDVIRDLISDPVSVQEIMTLAGDESPKLFPDGETGVLPVLGRKIHGMSVNPVQLSVGFKALFLFDLRETHACGFRNVSSYIQSSLLLVLSGGISFLNENLKHSRVRSIRNALISIGGASDAQTLESLFASEMNRLLGETERYCVLELSRTNGRRTVRSCLCRDRTAQPDAIPPLDDVNLEKAVHERLPVVLFDSADAAHESVEDPRRVKPDAGHMTCYIPYSVSDDTLTVLYARKSVPSRAEFDVEGDIISLSSAFLAKSEEFLFRQKLYNEKKRLSELNGLISSFSFSGLKIDGTVRGAAMLAGSFSSFRVVAYFEKRAKMECLSFATRGAAETDIPEIDTLPIGQLMRYTDALTFEIADAESESLKKEVVSSFSGFLGGDERTCTILCLRRGTEPFSYLVVFSSEHRADAVLTCALLKSIIANMSMLSAFRERLSIEREIGFANRNMLDEIGRIDADADIHALSVDFCRLLSSFSGSEACILYYQSQGVNFEFTAAFPEDSTEPSRTIRLDDLGLRGLAQTEVSVLRHFVDREGAYSKLLNTGKSSYLAWDVILIRDRTNAGSPDCLILLGYTGDPREHESEKTALLQLSKAFTKLVQIKLMSFSQDTASSMDVGFLNLIFSSARFDNGKWESDDEEVASSFSSLMAKALGMKYSAFYRTDDRGAIVIDGSNPSLRGLGEEAVSDCADMISELTADSAENRSVVNIDQGILASGKRASISSVHIGHAMIVPVSDPHGALRSGFFLFDEKRRGYAHTRVAMTIADAYATVMENRMNRMKMEWTLNALASELKVVRNISSTFELPVILNYASLEVNTFVGADLTCLFLENDMGAMHLASAAGPPKEIIEEVLRKPLVDIHIGEARRNGFASLAADSVSHFYMSDTASAAEAFSRMPSEQRYDMELLNRGMPVKCMAGVPVSFAGKMLGILACFSTSRENAFRETEIGFIESVAALLATAIENSRNFRTTYDALNKLSKLDTLRSNFSSIAAHELRTPLTSIRVYIELMKMGRVGKFTEPEKKNIENLLASITELNEIISNMLEFTRMEALLLETEMSPTSLVPVVEEVCALVSPQINAKPIELELNLDRNTRRINANAPLIKRVANNLLGNAIKFTPPEGRISVSLRNESDGVLLTVSDTGRGISEDDLPFIFDRYHVVDASILHSGTGFRFGLPITKLIVERHGGKIWAESTLGKGSSFFVFLPLQKTIYREEWLSEATNYIH